MPDRNDVYKCSDCPVMIEVIGACDCDCTLQCGDSALELVEANTVDAATEKHVPVIEKIDWGYKVKVGSVPHPMTPEHLIEWIELIAGNRVYKIFLTPDDQPEADFYICADSLTVREHCNLHGLWEASL